MRALLILGAAVGPDGPSPTLARRTRHAAEVWARGGHDLIIPCGGLGKHPPEEAAVMRRMLIAEGVPEQVIEVEDRSTTTLENIRNALPILKRHRIAEVTIVTCLTHAPRARLVARHFGLVARTSSARGPVRPKALLREAGALPLYALRLRRTDPPAE